MTTETLRAGAFVMRKVDWCEKHVDVAPGVGYCLTISTEGNSPLQFSLVIRGVPGASLAAKMSPAQARELGQTMIDAANESDARATTKAERAQEAKDRT